MGLLPLEIVLPAGIDFSRQKLTSTDIRFWWLNPFKPEFTIVIFIHNKPQIAAAILDL